LVVKINAKKEQKIYKKLPAAGDFDSTTENVDAIDEQLNTASAKVQGLFRSAD